MLEPDCEGGAGDGEGSIVEVLATEATGVMSKSMLGVLALAADRWTTMDGVAMTTGGAAFAGPRNNPSQDDVLTGVGATVGTAAATCDVSREMRAGVAAFVCIVGARDEIVLTEGAIEAARGRPMGVRDRVEDRGTSVVVVPLLPLSSKPGSAGRFTLITRGVV